MKSQKGSSKKKSSNSGLVAVAVDKDKGSQHALKWAADHLVSKGQTIILLHVILGSSTDSVEVNAEKHKQAENLFVTFHCYCSRKEIQCLDVTLEDDNIVKSLAQYVSTGVIETLVLGAPSRHGFIRKFKMSDTPGHVAKAVPDFCTVYIISKNKISSIRNATRSAPYRSPLISQIENHSANSNYEKLKNTMSFKDITPERASGASSIEDFGKSPMARRTDFANNFYDLSSSFNDLSDADNDISIVYSSRPSTTSSGRPSTVSSGRPSTTRSDLSFGSSGRPSTSTLGSPSFVYEFPDSGLTPRKSTSSGQSIGSMRLGIRFNDTNIQHDFSFVSQDSGRSSCSCSPQQSLEEVEAEMRRLKQELKHTVDMYGSACREALAAKQEAKELQRQRMEEGGWVPEEKLSEKSTKSIKEKERATKAAMDASETASKIAELETQRRTIEAAGSFSDPNLRYRRYSIGEIEEATNSFDQANKIGEGGYGPVYKGHLDHTPVAVKVLRPDAAQGRSQFQREVEVLSCIRHPHMVLLIGACPEYGMLVYEYMAKGSLDDRLYRHGRTPPLSWELRFRIAAEVATGLLFLHQTKPEPIVHGDLKPGNILIDQNYVSKIGDVGLAKLVPEVAENVTHCNVTSAAGNFCYIDPEYQQTGRLGVKSDVYSFGILLLELLTAKKPTGLAHKVELAMEIGKFKKMLDPAVPNWPLEEALSLARIALKCALKRKKDRPDLGKEVLPELNRLRALADVNMEWNMFNYSRGPSSNHSQISLPPVDEMSVTSDNSSTHSNSFSDTDNLD